MYPAQGEKKIFFYGDSIKVTVLGAGTKDVENTKKKSGL